MRRITVAPGRREFLAAPWNPELRESVFREKDTIENVADRLRFLSVTRCDISTEFESIASHFHHFLRHPDAPFSMPYKIIGHGSLSIESEDKPCDFIGKWKTFSVLEFIRFEGCSTTVMKGLSGHLDEMSRATWATLPAQLNRRDMRTVPDALLIWNWFVFLFGFSRPGR
jgi:hypothetical protein